MMSLLQPIIKAWQSSQRDTALNLAHTLLKKPDLSAENLTALTEILRQLRDLDAALDAGQRAVQLAPDSPAAHNNLGLVWLEQANLDTAETHFRHALKCAPSYLRAYHNLAKVWIEQGRLTDAEAILRQALARESQNPHAWTMLGSIARRRYDLPQALACCTRALAIAPNFLRARLNQAAIWQEQGQVAAAAQSLRQLCADYPYQAEVWSAWAESLERQRRTTEAAEAYTRTLALRPNEPALEVALADVRRKLCDWRTDSEDFARIMAHTQTALAAGRCPALPALTSLRFPTTAAEQFAIAQAHARRIAAQAGAALPPVTPSWQVGEPLRVGFLTHEFRQNVVGHLLRHLPAAFDRRRVEVHAFVYNADDGSAVRRDLVNGCDQVHDLTHLSAQQAAQQIRQAGIHLLLEVSGYMQEARPEIAALRPAPVQINYLYPGTMGAPWIDYLLTDSVVMPPDQRAYYQEQPVYLPASYLPATARIPLATQRLERKSYGLPETGFVYASFNKEDKLDAETFALWMSLLAATPTSVLWLAAAHPARPFLQQAAQAAKVNPQRLIFAENEPDMGVHLARMRCADLFLDTLIHGAHATAADALWSGLPVLTRLGKTYAGRVAASLLTALGLPELIALDTASYYQRGIEWAQHPERLAVLRTRLQQQQENAALFDPACMARHLEEAFEQIWQRYQRGEPPATLWIGRP